jgi:epoxide hydrolase-like predicted phosphatase
MSDHQPSVQARALVVDWGGVLTVGMDEAMTDWATSEGIDVEHYFRTMRDLLGAGVANTVMTNPVHALERGEIEVPHFEEVLAAQLRTVSGAPVQAEGLLSRMFAAFAHAPAMSEVVRRGRAGGLRTGLLSNSWGDHYLRDGWDELFDAVVISGEVGMRKPEPAIYHHMAALLRLEPGECVFVDDMAVNVRGAVEAGMIGVHHTTFDATVVELEAIFGMVLAPRQ